MKLKTKKAISALLIAANTVIPANITLAKEESKTHSEVRVYFNNEQIEFDQQPIIVDGRTKVPFRAIFETMGTVVYYRESDNSILGITRDGDSIYHAIGTNKAIINGEHRTYDSVSEIINDRTLIPVRMVADLLKAQVEWNEKTKEVKIEKTIETNNYHTIVRGILGCVVDKNFNPEDFSRYIEYQMKYLDMDPKQVVIDVNMDLDKELIEVDGAANIPGTHPTAKESDKTLIQDLNDPLILVNRFNVLPDNYKPAGLIRCIPMNSNFEEELKPETLNAFNEMATAALNDGIKIEFREGYPSISEPDVSVMHYLQEEYYSYMTNPLRNVDEGCTGYAMKIVYFAFNERYMEYAIENNKCLKYGGEILSWEATNDFYNIFKPLFDEDDVIFKWVEDNSYKYGIVVRYPKGKEGITRYLHTQWNLRYVGKEVAQIMHDENICFEEYWARYLNPSKYKTDLESTKKKVLERY